MANYVKKYSKRVLTLSLLATTVFSVGFAQTPAQRQKIKQSNKAKVLKAIGKKVHRSSKQLKAIEEKAKRFGLVTDTVINGKAVHLVDFDQYGRPRYISTSSRASADIHKVSPLWQSGGTYNLEGQNMTIYQWDEGRPLLTHQDFGNKVRVGDSSYRTSSHSTGVASCMISSGVNPNVKGMAPQANLVAYDWNHDLAEINAALSNGAILANASYGNVRGWNYGDWGGANGYYWMGPDEMREDPGFGAYGDVDAIMDLMAANAPYYLHVYAAGNSQGGGPGYRTSNYYIYDTMLNRWTISKNSPSQHPRNGANGYDCIPLGTLSKNTLAVGAIDRTDALRGRYTLASFSSTGPANDGRIKPDLCAVGTSVNTAADTGNKNYRTYDGTSFAAPITTSALMLLQQHYSELHNGTFMKAPTLRALAINCASEAGDNIGPDYRFGWGVLNALDAANAITNNGTSARIIENTLQQGGKQTIKVKAQGGEPLKATLAWIDPASPTLTNLNVEQDRTHMLVNDLDIRITDANGNEVQPWILDPAVPSAAAEHGDNVVDNVEQVYIANPVAGMEYTITVSHKGQLKTAELNYRDQIVLENANSQDYSLVVTGLTSLNKNLGIKDIAINYKDEKSEAEIIVYNNGTTQIENAKLKVERLINDKVEETKDITIAKIEAGKQDTLKVVMDLSKLNVAQVIRATITVNGDEQESDNTMTVDARNSTFDLRPAGAATELDFEDDIANHGYTTLGTTFEQHESKDYAYEGSKCGLFSPKKPREEGWLISNKFLVEPGKSYKLSFYTRYFKDNASSLEVFMGSKADKLTTKLQTVTYRYSEKEYKKVEITFTPTEETVYLGFHHVGKGYYYIGMVAIDNIRVANQQAGPEVSFTADKVNVNTSEVVTFINNTVSESPVTAWEWSFNPTDVQFVENTSATSEAPKVKFLSNATYTVTLKATTKDGTSDFVRKDYIHVAKVQTAPEVSFTADKVNVNTSEVVTFTNNTVSESPVTAWEWSFNPTDVQFVENTSATSEAPKVKFLSNATYTVTLKATNKNGTSDFVRKDYIHVAKVQTAPEVSFTADKLNVNRTEVVTFINNTVSESPVTAWEWSFNPTNVQFVDNTSATSEAPKVKFLSNAKYTVTLKATNKNGTSDFVRKDYITSFTESKPVAMNFRASRTQVLNGEEVVFINTTQGDPQPEQITWTISPAEGWTIVDGTVNSDKVKIRFDKANNYTVNLLSNNGDILTIPNLVKVTNRYKSITDLKAVEDNGEVKLTWNKPQVDPFYNEGLQLMEQDRIEPRDIMVLNSATNESPYQTTTFQYKKYSDTYNRGYSFISRGNRYADVDSWLVLPVMPAGVDSLKFMGYHKYFESYEILLVPTNSIEMQPTIEDLQKGIKVFEWKGKRGPSNWTPYAVSISEHTQSPFFVAFHHNTPKGEPTLYLALDNIEVGYSNDNPTVMPTGYIVKRNGEIIATIEDPNTTEYTESLANGGYQYSVEAIYGNQPSKEQTVEISIVTDIYNANTANNVVITKVDAQRYRITANNAIEAINAYNTGGVKIFGITPKTTSAVVDFQSVPVGVYMLNITTADGKTHVCKMSVR